MNIQAPLELRVAARAYWYHLVPVLLFPSIAVILVQQKKVATPFWLLGLLFFAASFYAMWPVIRGRAQKSFWWFACGLYLIGIGLALIGGMIVQSS